MGTVMNCPHCGLQNPLNHQCAKCGTDLSPWVNKSYQSLLYYRLTVATLFILCLWLAFEGSQKKPPPTELPPISDTFEKEVAEPQKRERRKRRQPQRATSPTHQFTSVILNKHNHHNYAMLRGLQMGYRGNLKIHNVRKDTPRLDLESDQNQAVVAIGKLAIDQVQNLNLNKPLVLIALKDDVATRINAPNTYMISPRVSATHELRLILSIFKKKTHIYFVASPRTQKPNAQILEKSGIHFEVLNPNPAVLERQIDNRNPDESLVWLYDLNPEQTDQILALGVVEQLDSLLSTSPAITLTPESPPEKASDLGKAPALEINRPKPLMAFKLTPDGLGLQGALLVSKISQNQKISADDQMASQALELWVYLEKAIELNREALIEELQRRGPRVRLSVKILP